MDKKEQLKMMLENVRIKLNLNEEDFTDMLKDILSYSDDKIEEGALKEAIKRGHFE